MQFDNETAVNILKLLIPALGAWGAAWLTNRRERRQENIRREAEQRHLLSSQADRLTAGWSEMTTQAREIITRLQVETIDAKTRAAVAEEKADNLERELTDIKRRYEESIKRIEELETTTRRDIRPRLPRSGQ